MSVIQRINSGTFDLAYDVGRPYVAFLGALRPVLGAAFGLVLYFAVASGLLDIFKLPSESPQRFFAFFVIAFLAGFSERWAQDTLTSLGQGSGKTDPATPASPAAVVMSGSRPPNLQAVAERHAPLVVLDKKEELFPTSAEDFIANCDLVWVTKPGKVTRVVDSVDPAHLAADAYTSPVAQWRGTTVAASFHTRPFDSRLRQPPGLPPRRGWALSLQDIDTAVGTRSTAAQPDVYEGAPVYFEWTARDGHCYLTYWFCYAGSGLPFDVAEAVKATHDPGGALLTGAPDDASASSALQALAVAHPDLYKGATSAMREATDQQGELLLFRNPISGALDWVRDIIENKAPTLWKASGNPHFLCHQGDWESLSLELDPADLLGTPRGLVLFQHGKPSPVAWNEVEKVEGGHARPRVQRVGKSRDARESDPPGDRRQVPARTTVVDVDRERRTGRERPRAGGVVRVRRGVGGSR